MSNYQLPKEGINYISALAIKDKVVPVLN